MSYKETALFYWITETL